jgi:ABC-type cobalamin/Fe3+-siderophores transport system ATPase subunit
MNTAIEIDNLSLSLSGQPILENISFAMPKGAFMAIIGPNGAGKTSLIKCLCGIYRPDSGRIQVLHQNAQGLSYRQRARLISYVPQADGNAFTFTVEEFVLMGRYTRLSPFSTVSPDDRRAVSHALEKTETMALRHRTLNTLSGGERQMVFIAAALAQEAEILVLDEPASFLDYRHQTDVFRLLKRLNREQGHSIVTVSHNVNTATRNSSLILAIKDRKRVFLGSPKELLTDNHLDRIYDIPFRYIQEPDSPLPLVATEAEA